MLDKHSAGELSLALKKHFKGNAGGYVSAISGVLSVVQEFEDIGLLLKFK